MKGIKIELFQNCAETIFLIAKNGIKATGKLVEKLIQYSISKVS